jgi:hypothetical protein
MKRQCCTGGPAWCRLARWLSKGAASVLPGALLIFLPKCPLCLAAWLTAVTGIGFTAAGAEWAKGIAVVSWIAAVALAVPAIRRHALGRVSESTTTEVR